MTLVVAEIPAGVWIALALVSIAAGVIALLFMEGRDRRKQRKAEKMEANVKLFFDWKSWQTHSRTDLPYHICDHIDKCPKIAILMDKDLPDMQMVETISRICERCYWNPEASSWL